MDLPPRCSANQTLAVYEQVYRIHGSHPSHRNADRKAIPERHLRSCGLRQTRDADDATIAGGIIADPRAFPIVRGGLLYAVDDLAGCHEFFQDIAAFTFRFDNPYVTVYLDGTRYEKLMGSVTFSLIEDGKNLKGTFELVAPIGEPVTGRFNAPWQKPGVLCGVAPNFSLLFEAQ